MAWVYTHVNLPFIIPANTARMHVRTHAMSKVIGDVAAGLAHMHRLNIVHRDIKPANIFFFAPVSVPVPYD